MVRIVILGGGFAGTTAARRLEQIFGADAAVEITLVDRENFSEAGPGASRGVARRRARGPRAPWR
ncbi:MAG: FAD-dependent oxidoreductase [Candidatus Rokubacteria bacterium]|nr:FAD-dependent oxidoreductase [Candidatus Rokubacteria bacterium]